MPPFELRLSGRPAGTFPTEPEAMDAARAAVRADADCMPEVLDLATGKSAAPGASQAEQEALAREVGF